MDRVINEEDGRSIADIGERYTYDRVGISDLILMQVRRIKQVVVSCQ
jgi:hypothetical protein